MKGVTKVTNLKFISTNQKLVNLEIKNIKLGSKMNTKIDSRYFSRLQVATD